MSHQATIFPLFISCTFVDRREKKGMRQERCIGHNTNPIQIDASVRQSLEQRISNLQVQNKNIKPMNLFSHLFDKNYKAMVFTESECISEHNSAQLRDEEEPVANISIEFWYSFDS